VLFDEAFTLLASRAAAFLLEPKLLADALNNVATLLELVATAFRTTGNKTGREQAAKCTIYAQKCRLGQAPKTKIVAAAASLIAASGAHVWTGRVRDDWRKAKATLHADGEPSFDKLARSLDYLMTFRRGQRLGEALDDLWLNQGSYAGARAALDNALAQDQLLSAGEPARGIHVMNMHKCKGKQFDGVVLYRQQHHSPFVWRDPNSRGLLHMAITRARCHVLVLNEVYSKCPIVGPHRLANVFG
jgi:DNA helicase II / ATP-dependent DNA helicase PcrA